MIVHCQYMITGRNCFLCLFNNILPHDITFFADVYAAAVGRCPCDCAICMLPVGQATSAVVAGTGAHSSHASNSRRDVVLSCSHIFHEKCIGNFERFLSDTVSSLTSPLYKLSLRAFACLMIIVFAFI